MKDITGYKIIVNAREHIWGAQEISYEQAVILAFGHLPPNPNVIYTVTYKKGYGGKEGLITIHKQVKVQDGMNINVAQTNES